MNEIRKVARACFDGREEDEKKLARRFFESLDENGDGKVSLREYRKHVDSRFSSDQMFKKLDENGDGTLDFEEVLTIYYMDNVCIPRCSGCHDLLLSSSYFSCLPCLGKNSYHLCCTCYGGGKFQHHHLSTNFADTRALLKLMDRLMANAEVATANPHDPDASKEVQNDGAGSCKAKPKQSSPTPTRSTTETVVRTLAYCATRTIIFKGITVALAANGVTVTAVANGVTVAAIASGCCIM